MRLARASSACAHAWLLKPTANKVKYEVREESRMVVVNGLANVKTPQHRAGAMGTHQASVSAQMLRAQPMA